MLDIKVIRDNDCIILSRIYYVKKMLKIFEHFDYIPMSTDSTPYDLKIHLVKNHGDGVFARKVCTNH
jgi:hypothetical protein